MKTTYYPDMSSYVTLDDSKPDEYYKEIIFRLNDYASFFRLAQLVDVINHNRKFKPTIIIPNLLDAQADKRFNSNESSGLKIVCDFLNTLKVEKYKIFHPHNPSAVEAYLPEAELISNKDFIMTILVNDFDYGMIETDDFIPRYKNLVLLSVDAGGFKPLVELCSEIGWKGERISAAKSHSYDTDDKDKYIQELARLDFKGKDVLVVDDISVYGGTFKGISNLLEGRNVNKKYLAVSHGTVQNLGDNPVTNFYDTVYVSDSKYPKYYTENKDPWAQDLGPQPNNLKVIQLYG